MTAPTAVPKDPATHSNYDEISTTHVHFNWEIDWSQRRFVGSATHTLVVHKEGVKSVVFDSSLLVIDRVTIGGKTVKHDLGPIHPVLGSPLTIPLPSSSSSPLKIGDKLELTIEYSTTRECTAVGWLEKEQTAGKKFEYLFSQCQPIHARTLAPLQDSPSVKLTYSANVKSVLPVLFSAIRVSPPSEEVHGGKTVGVDVVEYIYNQPTPIPSYLIAIASGNIIYKPFPPHASQSLLISSGQKPRWTTGVWTEPELMQAAYWEFEADTARYVHEAEELVTPYEFGVYDLLVLPPSFPYGGMENACLTFVTPTLLAGDRSLVDVVGHEISHSWFGNNVTTADSGHFWLNEGWTTWLERVLQGVLHGPAERDFSYIIGRKALNEALKQYESTDPEVSKYQRLVIEYAFGEDPDDAYSSIPYEKGSNFLLYLERLLGGLDVFIPYAKDYVTTFRGKSIRSSEWKDHLYAYFSKNGGEEKIQILDSVDWNAWFYGEGLTLPVDIPYDTTLANDAYLLAKRWNDARSEEDPSSLFAKSDLNTFNSNQKVVFLERLSDIGGASLPASHIKLLDSLYELGTTPNVEVRLRFYNLVLASPTAAPDYLKPAADWVVDPKLLKGRMKFCRPVFRKLHAVDANFARATWRSNAQFFHPIAKRMIEKDLGIASDS